LSWHDFLKYEELKGLTRNHYRCPRPWWCDVWWQKINASIGASEEAAAVPTAKPQKMVHVRFCWINCLFSDELSSNANSEDSVDRAALDAGAVG